MRPCHADHPLSPALCRLCFLYVNDSGYRALWDGPPAEPAPPARALPCVYLGEVLERGGCPCPGKWLRGCGLHAVCTLEVCKTCEDYEER
ncbi:MAG TPA: hypothetical protein VKA46_23320 [Gemmataceae bacterium]|nr:hypothetical protein [Gemmataceae bacterium]